MKYVSIAKKKSNDSEIDMKLSENNQKMTRHNNFINDGDDSEVRICKDGSD